MNKTALALLMTGVSWGALAACGEQHDILGSRVDGGGPGAGTAGQGAAGGATGGSESGAGPGNGGHGAGETGDGLAGVGSGTDAGGAGGSAGSSAGTNGSGATAGSGDAGATGGSSSGEAGGTSAGTAGTAGAGGVAPGCPIACTRGATGSCTAGQVMWTCGNEHDHQALLDGGCTDLASDAPRYCCPPEFYAECACTALTTLEACEARPDCHSVFTDPGPETCRCSEVGCCARFSHCATGAFANCTGPATCASPTPFCDEPAYVLAYANGCFEGCVVPEDCAIQ